MKDPTLYEKLLRYVRKDEQTGCWNWTGSVWKNRPHPGNRYGYMTVKFPDGRWRARGAHRLMMIAIHGPLTPERCACHKCDNVLCINPDHLFVGSMKDNIWDSRNKGRHYESRREYCERGHPLFGPTARIKNDNRGGGVKRVCKICEVGRYRLKAGWPEHLAFNHEFKVPNGYMLDRETWAIVPSKGRQHSSAGEKP